MEGQKKSGEARFSARLIFLPSFRWAANRGAQSSSVKVGLPAVAPKGFGAKAGQTGAFGQNARQTERTQIKVCRSASQSVAVIKSLSGRADTGLSLRLCTLAPLRFFPILWG